MNKYGQISVSTFLLCFLVTSTQIKLKLRTKIYILSNINTEMNNLSLSLVKLGDQETNVTIMCRNDELSWLFY